MLVIIRMSEAGKQWDKSLPSGQQSQYEGNWYVTLTPETELQKEIAEALGFETLAGYHHGAMIEVVLGTPVLSRITDRPRIIPEYLDYVPEIDDLWDRLAHQAQMFQDAIPLCTPLPPVEPKIKTVEPEEVE